MAILTIHYKLLSSLLLMKPINDIFPLLDKPIKIAITTHQKPDADAMGSSLALYNFLIQFGHAVTVISPTNWASWVNWMPGSKKVLDYELQFLADHAAKKILARKGHGAEADFGNKQAGVAEFSVAHGDFGESNLD